MTTDTIDIARALNAPLQPGAAEPTDPLERLAQAMARVRQLCPTLAVAAIHWMTVKHPIQPAQERLIQEAEGGDAGSVKRGSAAGLMLALRMLRCAGYAVCLSALLVWLRWRLREALRSVRRQRFELIAKSWWFEADAHWVARDFYYGDLPQRLEPRGVRTLLLWAEGAGISLRRSRWERLIQACLSPGPMHRLPELALAPPWAPLAMAASQLRSSLALRRLARRGGEDPWLSRVSAAAATDCLSRQTADNGLLFWIARAAVKRWRPAGFLALYEGNSWERCAWLGVRAAGWTCRAIGYQHTVLLRHNLTLLRPLAPGLIEIRPDAVLCIGRRTAAMIQRSHAAAVGVAAFGTFRRQGPAGAATPPDPSRRSVLVLPEGYIEEEKRLFDAALAAAERLPDHRFIFRCHPAAPYEQVRARLARRPEDLHNVEVSGGRTIEQEFARASVLLYRGSSSVLHAVREGLKPVYWDESGCWDVDPLFELTTWSERVTSIESLTDLLHLYADTPPHAAAQAWTPAAGYVEDYALPVTDPSVHHLLHAMRKA